MNKRRKFIADNVTAQIHINGQTIKCTSWSFVEEVPDTIGIPQLIETKVEENGKCTTGPALDPEVN